MLDLDFSRELVDVEDLLLDPNNPRFFDIEEWEKTPENLFHLDRVQEKAFRIIESTNIGRIKGLKKSIENNGYLPIEMIIVKNYNAVDDVDKYVVVEGNRRLAAIKSIIENSVDPNDELVESLEEIEVLVYQESGDEETDQLNEMVLQGIRHIGGPKEWGAYQKANLVAKLKEERELSWTDIGEKIGLSAVKTARFYRAFKALNQMKEDEEFSELAELKLFSLFDEAMIPPLRQWLGWKDENWKFNNENKRKAFYRLIVGDPADEMDPIITNPQRMRDFRKLISSGKTNVLNRFLSNEISLDQAMRLIEPEPVQVSIKDASQTYFDQLNELPAEKLMKLEEEEINLLNKVIEEIEKLLSMYKKLNAE